jgi:hypothetical protein
MRLKRCSLTAAIAALLTLSTVASTVVDAQTADELKERIHPPERTSPATSTRCTPRKKDGAREMKSASVPKEEAAMKRLFVLTLVVVTVGLFGANGYWQTVAGQAKAPPGGEYKKVSSLVKLPDFLPGLGTLYVVPSTLPVGPFLAYDRDGTLVSSVYMIPIKDIDAHKKFDNLNVAREKVDHVDMYYNAGHPGVPEPHYHVVLWYIPKDKVAALN